MYPNAFHREELSITPYRRIGAGLCGSVWSNSEHTVIKREDGGPMRSLSNDYKMHQTVLEAYKLCPANLKSVLIPDCHDYVEASYEGWKTTNMLDKFPTGYSPCNILISQRIPPFGKVIRDAIVDRYCPPSLIENIKADEKNDHCLIRPYLGRRKPGQQDSRVRVFSLRNYPLHVNRMEQLGSDPFEYSRVMAHALAFMHWLAKVDANDVEYVLAPSKHTLHVPTSLHSEVLKHHNMWILDFDCCRPMSMDKEGIEQAAAAFLRNDPYYPRPVSRNMEDEDKHLWNYFKAAFLKASLVIINEAVPDVPKDLPQLLLDTIESKAQRV